MKQSIADKFAVSISGAYVGASQMPQKWLNRVREEVYTPQRLNQIAHDLFEKGRVNDFTGRKSK